MSYTVARDGAPVFYIDKIFQYPKSCSGFIVVWAVRNSVWAFRSLVLTELYWKVCQSASTSSDSDPDMQDSVDWIRKISAVTGPAGHLLFSRGWRTKRVGWRGEFLF